MLNKDIIKTHKEIFVSTFISILILSIIFYSFKIEKEILIYTIILILVFNLCYLLYKLYQTKNNITQIKAYTRDLNSNFYTENIETKTLISEMTRIVYDYKSKLEEQNKNTEDFKRFITTWTHQIKTPISAMNLQLNGELNKFELKNNIFSIEEYLNLLLNYFRHNSKSTDYVFKEINLDEVIREVIRKYAGLFIKKGISLKYEPKDVFIVTDYKWLMFCIEQIVSNALKYTEEGSVKIVVNENEIVIADTGIGIAKEDIKRVTELGYTGYNGRVYSKSTGIGLYLTKEILKKLNLNLKISSDKGTKVSIEFNNITKM